MSNILEQLSQLVQQAVTQAVKAGTLPKISPDDLKIEISKPNKNFGGDYSCGVALTLTRALKRPPMQIGEAIEAAFPEAPDVVEKIWLTPLASSTSSSPTAGSPTTSNSSATRVAVTPTRTSATRNV